MRRVGTSTGSSGGERSLSLRNSPSLQPQHALHGPWNRKSITTILSQQQHHCYGSRHDGSNPPSPTPIDADAPSALPPPTTSSAQPSYTLLDLVSVGVGGTVGSGIFVLTGYIANHYAGPATFLSFVVSGLAALCSGISFAEFSSRLPRIEGSTYTYAYVSMGEYAAVLAASCLTLEYGVSGAAVARSWGDKVVEWMARSGLGNAEEVDHRGQSEAFFNPLAGLISLASVVVLACGVQESKRVTNFFTITKMGLVLVMIVGGFCLWKAEYMIPLVIPTQVSEDTGVSSFGPAGILRGATSSFFGYLGFDEVVCLAAEAKNPSDTPRAVLWTLACVTVVYILASIALCGMLPYEEISDTSGFPNAFHARGISWAANLTAFGEVFTLPVVVLISLLAQPRLCAAMAKDGLLPAIFALQNASDGNLFWSNILCGIPMTLLATFVPFSWMDDAISVGILFAFNMTNTALIIMRCNHSNNSASSAAGAVSNHNYSNYSDSIRDAVLPTDQDVVIAVDEANGIVSSSYPKRSTISKKCSLVHHLFLYHLAALLAGLTSHLTVSSGNDTVGENQIVSTPWWSAQIGAALVLLAYALWFHKRFPATGGFGDQVELQLQRSHGSNADFGNAMETDQTSAWTENLFEVPVCPLFPLVGIYLNWYLISQLEWSGMVLLFIFLVLISVLYWFCISGSPATHSMVSSGIPSQQFQQQQRYSPVPNPGDAVTTASASSADGPVLLREMSLPKRTVT